MLVSLNECYHIKILLSNLQSRMMAWGILELVHKSGLRVGLVCVLLIICCSARPWDQEQEESRKGQSGHGSSIMAFTSPAVKPQEPNPWMVNVDPYIPKWNESTDVNFEPPAAAAPDIFNVLLYNAAGDGVTDDTKVVYNTDRTLWLFIHFIVMTRLINNSSQVRIRKITQPNISKYSRSIALWVCILIFWFLSAELLLLIIRTLNWVDQLLSREPISFWKCLISLYDVNWEGRTKFLDTWLPSCLVCNSFG